MNVSFGGGVSSLLVYKPCLILCLFAWEGPQGLHHELWEFERTQHSHLKMGCPGKWTHGPKPAYFLPLRSVHLEPHLKAPAKAGCPHSPAPRPRSKSPRSKSPRSMCLSGFLAPRGAKARVKKRTTTTHPLCGGFPCYLAYPRKKDNNYLSPLWFPLRFFLAPTFDTYPLVPEGIHLQSLACRLERKTVQYFNQRQSVIPHKGTKT